MNKGANIFGAALVAYWLAVALSGFFPIKDNISNVAILAVAGFIFAGILGLLGAKDKLF